MINCNVWNSYFVNNVIRTDLGSTNSLVDCSTGCADGANCDCVECDPLSGLFGTCFGKTNSSSARFDERFLYRIKKVAQLSGIVENKSRLYHMKHSYFADRFGVESSASKYSSEPSDSFDDCIFCIFVTQHTMFRE